MDVITKALEWAEHFVGTKEVPPNSNRGLIIDDIQKQFGYKGVQYCSLFVQYCYKRACDNLNIPFPFSGTASSQTLYQEAAKAGFTATDFSKLLPGDIVIWRKLKLWQGHVGIVKEVVPVLQKFISIEGNTSDSDFGDQRDGGGIYQRIRFMKKIDFTVDNFYLRGFIPVRKVFNLIPVDIDAKPLEEIKPIVL